MPLRTILDLRVCFMHSKKPFQQSNMLLETYMLRMSPFQQRLCVFKGCCSTRTAQIDPLNMRSELEFTMKLTIMPCNSIIYLGFTMHTIPRWMNTIIVTPKFEVKEFINERPLHTYNRYHLQWWALTWFPMLQFEY